VLDKIRVDYIFQNAAQF